MAEPALALNILGVLQKFGSVSVGFLSDTVRASRKDVEERLADLEKAGVLERDANKVGLKPPAKS